MKIKKILLTSLTLLLLLFTISCGDAKDDNPENLNPESNGIINALPNISNSNNQEQGTTNVTNNSLNVPYPNYSSDKISSNSNFEEMMIEVSEYVSTTSVMILVESNGGISLGSGVIYKQENNSYYVLTNDHVVDGGTKFTITTTKEKDIEAMLLNTSPTYDVAVLKFETTENYNAIKFEESDVKIGSYAIAVGTPLSADYMNTVTYGNVSKIMDGEILHTASINSGNSGGGLFNTKGNLIGLNNSKLSGQTSSGASIDNMFFAVSLDSIKQAIDEMNSPKLGITAVSVEGVIAIGSCSNFYQAYYSYGVDENTYKQFVAYKKYLPKDVTQGLLIIDVSKDSNAYNHLEVGDVLVSIETVKIDSVANIKSILTSKTIGDSIKFEIYRNKELKTVEFKLLK